MRPNQPKYDLSAVRTAASGQWSAIISRIAGVSAAVLDGNHHPCPKCGGDDRFRLIDAAAGAVLCNQCARTGIGDGFAALQWLTGNSFPGVLADVAGYLGVSPLTGDSGSNGNAPRDPAHHLEFLRWNDLLIAQWCIWKQPITPVAIQAIGGRIARYRNRYTVLAIPVHGPQLAAADPVGWVIYNLSGGTLPKWPHKADGTATTEWVKIKLTHGSKAGIIADLDRLAARATTTIWKVEGPSDLLAMLTLADLPAEICPVTNANGAGEKPDEWVTSLFAGKIARVLHDADESGERGAAGWIDHRGQFRPGWGQAIAAKAIDCRHVKLPYPIKPDHGQDLRDWINEGKSYADLSALAEAGTLIDGNREIKVIEAADDPYYLAKLNIENYKRIGRTLRFWRGEWYKFVGTHYRKIKKEELEAKLSMFAKSIFDAANIEEQKNTSKDKGDEPPVCKKVTTTLINNMIRATAALSLIPDSVEPNTWLDQNAGQREQRRYIAMQNGILDLERLLADNDEDQLSDILLEHSPNWFSTVCLPYEFAPHAECSMWDKFLEHNLEMDPERIKLLQEWAGYLLLPDTGLQKFLALHGEGANGKSVFIAGLTAILGKENCSFVQLEQFGGRFEKTDMLGKLANFSADTGELDKVAEGYLKSMTSGDMMHFDRKNIDAIQAKPTARLIMAFNNPPRFTDRSSGIYRRMLLVPWRVQIQDAHKIYGMDSVEYWSSNSELPGMLWWAIQGLARLRSQRGFTKSTVCEEALEEYRTESNPARAFLIENVEEKFGSLIPASLLYRLYRKWVNEHGNMPLGERQFGKEIIRAFKNCKRWRYGTRENRFWGYDGIDFTQIEICGEKTRELF